MIFDIENMTIDSNKVLYRLQKFLENISNYDNFDGDMELDIFVNSQGDFTALEAVRYNLQFTNAEHKLSETIHSKYSKIRTNYNEFAKIVFSL